MVLNKKVIRRKVWTANKKTYPKPLRIPISVIDRAQLLKDDGDFDAAIELLKEQPEKAVASNSEVLSTIAMCQFGLGDLEGALQTFDRVDDLIQKLQAKSFLNRANILKVAKRYDEALSIAHKSRELWPAWSGGHLIVIAVLECRANPEDPGRVREAIHFMKSIWPGWPLDADLWQYLENDIDYAELRTRKEYQTLLIQRKRRSNEFQT